MFDSLDKLFAHLIYYCTLPIRYLMELPAVALGRLLAKPFGKLRVIETYSVCPDGIKREDSRGGSKSVFWNDVQRISIVTTDQGPFVDDFFYVFEVERDVLLVPLDWAVKLDLGKQLNARFDGFDNLASIMAAGSCENARFVLWSRDQPAAAQLQQEC